MAKYLVPDTKFAERFRVFELLGKGSMGAVYKVRDTDGSVLALKIMNSDLLSEDKWERRFEREATVGRNIPSHHVARVVDHGADPATGLRWIAMEYVEGDELGAFVQRESPLSTERACDVVRQLLAAVAAAHRAGVVHRDLKPENALVRENGKELLITVLDFGIAKSMSSSTYARTRPGLGTPLWVAPEQVKAMSAPLPAVDVWALGLLAFYVVTGTVYWSGANRSASLVELSMEILRDPIAPASVRATELGRAAAIFGGFDEWFARAVNREETERFPDAGAALVAWNTTTNRRTTDRYAIWVPITAPALHGGVGMAHDISDSGLRMVSRGNPAVGTVLRIMFQVPPESGEQYDVEAEVVRVGPNQSDPDGLWPHTIALRFATPMPELKSLLGAG